MPFTTVFATVKLELTRVAVKLSVPKLPSRVAESISTSEGELARVGTFPEGGSTESAGNTWYTSTSTFPISAGVAPEGIKPKMVAPLMTVVSVRIKSSAVSVSSLPPLGGWDSAPSRPSGLPVLKKNGAADAGDASHTTVLNATTARANFLMAILHDEASMLGERVREET